MTGNLETSREHTHESPGRDGKNESTLALDVNDVVDESPEKEDKSESSDEDLPNLDIKAITNI